MYVHDYNDMQWEDGGNYKKYGKVHAQMYSIL